MKTIKNKKELVDMINNMSETEFDKTLEFFNAVLYINQADQIFYSHPDHCFNPMEFEQSK